jgi:hypothetical protein
MTEFLVAYDYGTGGLWAFAEAQSENEIISMFPELTVVRPRPEWMNDQEEAKIRCARSFVVDDPRTYPDWLRAVIEDRK